MTQFNQLQLQYIGGDILNHCFNFSNNFTGKLLDNDNIISPSDSIRNLGVIYDSEFSFHKHVSNNYMQVMVLPHT